MFKLISKVMGGQNIPFLVRTRPGIPATVIVWLYISTIMVRAHCERAGAFQRFRESLYTVTYGRGHTGSGQARLGASLYVYTDNEHSMWTQTHISGDDEAEHRHIPRELNKKQHQQRY